MTFRDGRKAVIDLPNWEVCAFAPTATSAVSACCTPDVGSGTPVGDGVRFLYYIVGAAFYRYDTENDTWHQLSSPNVTPITGLAMKYAPYSGHRGRVLAADNGGPGGVGTMTMAPLVGYMLAGQKLRIISGTGAGQERTITGVSLLNARLDQGFGTTASATQLGDSTKKWRFNQFAGCQVQVIVNVGAPQIRTVLYNNATTLTVSDPLYQQIAPFENMGFSAILPHAVPITTAGSQPTFVIEQDVVTLESAWSVIPDRTSKYVILSGGIWLLSSLATPFAAIQYYDVLTDTWLNKTFPTGLILAAATEWNLERCGEVAGAFCTGFFDAGSTSRVLIDAAPSVAWTVDCYRNFEVRITAGSCIGQRRRIVANSTSTMTVDIPFEGTPDATSAYAIYGMSSKLWARFGGSAGMFQYCQEADLWAAHSIADAGIASSCSVWRPGEPGQKVDTGVHGVNGLKTFAINAPGTNYVVGDLITVSGTGTNGTLFVEKVSATGGVLSATLVRCGTGYSIANGVATAAGSGLNCTVDVLTRAATVGRLTTNGSHNFQKGETFSLGGTVTVGWAGAGLTVLAVDSLTTFDYETATSAGNLAIATAQSTTVVVDAAKNWTINEHAGKYVSTQPSGLAGALAIRRIDSNTAQTLTLLAGDALAAGLPIGSRYAILDEFPLGVADWREDPTKKGTGYATGGTNVTIVDSTKNWVKDQWAGIKGNVISGTGYNFGEFTCTANDATTLTVNALGWTPDATTKYQMLCMTGKCTGAGSTSTLNDTAKKWVASELIGRRVRIVAGAGAGNETTITGNTATQISFTAITGLAPDATTVYVVYGAQAVGAGGQMVWTYGDASTPPALKGKYLAAMRGGGSNIVDSFLVNDERWDLGFYTRPLFETFAAGAMMAYGGKNKIFVHHNNTGRIYAFDLITFKFLGVATVPITHGAVVAGNRMEIVQTTDGLQFLYVMRNTGAELMRTLLRET